MTPLSILKLAVVVIAASALPVAAGDLELSVYGGVQSATPGDVSGSRADGSAFAKAIGWQGKSLAMPPYYGARATWWRANNIGWGVEMTHTKVYAPAADMPAGFSRLEFTDGHNIITANVMKRWPDRWGRLTPYVGAGLGVAMPHVDVTENGNRTYGYQVTGPAVKALAGVKYRLGPHWALFSEAQLTWTDNDVDLAGGGRMQTQITTRALNFGVSYSF